jgi:hypothetical protein
MFVAPRNLIHAHIAIVNAFCPWKSLWHFEWTLIVDGKWKMMTTKIYWREILLIHDIWGWFVNFAQFRKKVHMYNIYISVTFSNSMVASRKVFSKVISSCWINRFFGYDKTCIIYNFVWQSNMLTCKMDKFYRPWKFVEIFETILHYLNHSTL